MATTLSTARHVGAVRGLAVDIRAAGLGKRVGGGHVPAIKLEIAIGDVVLRTDTAKDGEQLCRVIRSASITMIAAGADLKI
ncbi:hypothetical protein [Bradyrhizobium sp. WSM471]|uniref:hypothetical protein n=1 Tax=Bradyrhizobium sp. WSM471 TaxID=319017 RepID=UPI00056573EF|nr:MULTISPECIES: hypothetical protein [Bradyrhizobium]UFW45163.1 hypothetical protein BcanWSM471_07265 [Bradyrhizobium canariense]